MTNGIKKNCNITNGIKKNCNITNEKKRTAIITNEIKKNCNDNKYDKKRDLNGSILNYFWI